MNFTSRLRTLAVLPIHPFLIAIFPVLSLYAHNITQVAFASTLRAFGVFLAVAVLSFGGLYLLLRNARRAALTLTWGLVLFFLVVPVQNGLLAAGIPESLARLRFIVPFFALLFVGGAFLIRHKLPNYKQANLIANFVSITMVILPITNIISYEALIIRTADKTDQPVYKQQNSIGYYPDIYYIVLDMHGRTDAIKEATGYDNSPILDQLRTLGFYIASCSNANYPSATWQAMSSTLNMEYFDHEAILMQSPLITFAQKIDKLKQNNVSIRLKGYGYKYLTFSTDYDFLNITASDKYYNFLHLENSNVQPLNSFETLLIQNIDPEIIPESKLRTSHKVHYQNIKSIFSTLPKLGAAYDSPIFVYAHILSPHSPFVFSGSGEFVELETGTIETRYAEQVKFLDSKMVEIATEIVHNSETPPVIIIQGDHGFFWGDNKRGAAILNAYYLPEVDALNILYPSISPVNTFRLLFQQYFQEPINLLPDRTFFEKQQREWIGNFQSNTPFEFDEFALPFCPDTSEP